MKLLVLLYASNAWSQDFDFVCVFSLVPESEINQAVSVRSNQHR